MLPCSVLIFSVWQGGGNLLSHPFRTTITTLGVAIGAAAVLCLAAVREAATEKVTKAVAGIGTNLIVVHSASRTSSGIRITTGISSLKRTDAIELSKISQLSLVAPALVGTARLIAGNSNWSTQVQGTTEGYLELRDWELDQGANFTADDVRRSENVLVLGRTAARRLFADQNPVGQSLRIGAITFRVLGVAKPKGPTLSGRDQDDTAIIPISTAEKKVIGSEAPGRVTFIWLKVKRDAEFPEVIADCARVLRAVHKLTASQEDDFWLNNQVELAESQKRENRQIATLLAAIGFVSMVVSGLGVMNVMLVAVAERASEIAIRRTLGATKMSIAIQFIAEATVICIVGCVLGLLIGAYAGWTIAETLQIEMAVGLSSVLSAVSASLIVAAAFGVFPAIRASSVQPATALKAV